MSARITILLALAGWLSGPAHADTLYHVRGEAVLSDVLADAEGLIGVDAQGYVWETFGAANRSVRCRSLADPDATWTRVDVINNGASLVPGGVSGGGRFAAAIGADGSGLRVVGLRQDGDSPGNTLPWGRATAVQLAAIDCATVTAAENPHIAWTDLGRFNVPLGELPVLNKGSLDTAPQYELVMRGENFCFNTREGLRCLSVADVTNPLPVWQEVVPAALLEASLPIDLGYAHDATSGPLVPPTHDWRLRAFAPDPDGHLWFIAELQLLQPQTPGSPAPTSGWLPYVVRLDPDGALHPRIVPAPRGVAHKAPKPAQPLEFATHLVYEPQLDAMLAFPAVGEEYTQQDGGHIGGIGVYVIARATGEAPGYLSLTDAAIRAFGCSPKIARGVTEVCDTFGSFRGAFPLPGGAVGVTLVRGDPNDSPGTSLLGLDFDPASFDLDSDGLSGAEEVQLGSSDLNFNSDGFGASDFYEARVTHTDPTDPSDDPSRVDGGVSFAPSGLVRRILPAADYRTDVVRGGGTEGPLCFQGGSCVMPDRHTRVRFDAGGVQVQKAEDGSHLVFRDAAGIHHIDYTTGVVTLTVPSTELAIVGDGAPSDFQTSFQVVAASEDELWVAYQEPLAGNFRVAVKRGDAPLLLVYDHAAARCASGLGTCDGDWTPPPEVETTGYVEPHDLIMGQVRVAGYLRETRRLLIAVAGRWDKYLVGLHASDAPLVLEMSGFLSFAPGTQLLPDWLQPTGHDEYIWLGHETVVTQGPDGPDDDTRVVHDLYRAESGFRNALSMRGFLTYTQRPAAAWGDLVIVPDPSTGEATEIVRYDFDAQPGDVLVLGNEPRIASDTVGGAMLYRSGPRGGLAPVWSEERTDRDVWGLDVDANGYGCSTDVANLTITFLRPVEGTRTPSLPVASWGVSTPVDCDIDDDGRVSFLISDPPAIWRFDDPWTPPTRLAELPSRPVTFVDEADGSLGVLYESDKLRARFVLHDGRELTIAEGGWDVAIDGRVVMSLGAMVPGRSADWPAWARIIERPDGLVVIQPFGAARPADGTTSLVSPTVIDLDRQETYPLTDAVPLFYADKGLGMALIPGGLGGDPWAPSNPSARPPPTKTWPDGPDAPAVPRVPSDGTPVTITPRDDDSGCGGAGTTSSAWLVLAALLWVSARRSAAACRAA